MAKQQVTTQELDRLIREALETEPVPMGGGAFSRIIPIISTADGPNWYLSYSSTTGPNDHMKALDRVIPRLQSLYELVDG
jgi:hypothetical protein